MAKGGGPGNVYYGRNQQLSAPIPTPDLGMDFEHGRCMNDQGQVMTSRVTRELYHSDKTDE